MLPTLFVAPAWAAEFQAIPTLALAQYYTDNSGLAPPGQERSDWVTSVRPGISLIYTGANLVYNATYNAEILYHTLDSETGLNNQFRGSGTYQFVPQFLFIDSSSSVSQQNVSAFGAQPLNNINTTNNRTTLRTFLVSPYARYSFGGEANAQVRYTYSVVDSKEDIGQGVNSASDRIDASLTSGASYRGTTWGLAYYWERINYDSLTTNVLERDTRDTTLESITASVQRLITPTFALVGNLGYEDNNYPATQAASPSGTIWSVGFNWTPTPRTRLYLTAGHRFYGKTYALDFSHRTRLTVWSANYSEEVTSTRQQVLQPTLFDTATFIDTLFLTRIPDPIARQRAVQDEIARLGLSTTLLVPVNIFTDQVYIQKAFRATAGIQGVFHTVLVNAFNLRRDPQTPLLAAASGLEGELKQNGVGLTWAWRVTPLTTGLASLGYTRTEAVLTGRDENNQYARLALNHVLGPRTSGSISYQRAHNDSNLTAGYTENQVAAQVQMRF